MLLKKDIKTGRTIKTLSIADLELQDEELKLVVSNNEAYPDGMNEYPLSLSDCGKKYKVIASTSDKTLLSVKGSRNYIPTWAVKEIVK